MVSLEGARSQPHYNKFDYNKGYDRFYTRSICCTKISTMVSLEGAKSQPHNKFDYKKGYDWFYTSPIGCNGAPWFGIRRTVNVQSHVWHYTTAHHPVIRGLKNCRVGAYLWMKRITNCTCCFAVHPVKPSSCKQGNEVMYISNRMYRLR